MLNDKSKVSCMASQENHKNTKVQKFFSVVSVKDTWERHSLLLVSKNEEERAHGSGLRSAGIGSSELQRACCICAVTLEHLTASYLSLLYLIGHGGICHALACFACYVGPVGLSSQFINGKKNLW